MIHPSVNDKIRPGATVRVFEKFLEGEKERIRRFEGLVLARKHGNEAGASFTVRGTVAGVGVEKVFPINSPNIEKVEVVASPKNIRRAKLYYVRNISRKMIRKKTTVKNDVSGEITQKKTGQVDKKPVPEKAEA